MIAENDGHSKVLELWDNSSSNNSDIYNNFTAQIAGAVEFWVYGIAGTASGFYIRFWPTDAPQSFDVGPYLKVDWNSENLQYYVEPSYYDIIASPGFTEQTWHHIRVAFDCATDIFDIWVDGTPVGTGVPFNEDVSSIRAIDFATSYDQTSGNAYTYIDAVDYSWTPGYYPNRNMDYEPSPKDYLGVYSFTEDADGADPAGWDLYTEGPNTHADVIAEKDGHSKVMELWDNSISNGCDPYNNFTAQTAGTVEF